MKKLFENLQNASYLYGDQNKYHHLTCAKEEVEQLLFYFKSSMGFSFLNQIHAEDNLKSEVDEKRFTLYYHLKNLKNNNYILLQTQISEEEIMESVSSIWAVAEFFEREISELFGVHFNFAAKNFLLAPSLIGHPLRKDFKQFEKATNVEDSFLNVGKIQITPKDVFLNKLIKFNVIAREELIENLDIDFGYVHSGLEKTFEDLTADQFLLFTRRLHHMCSLTHNLLFAKTMEDLLEINIPEKAQAVRTIWAEIARIIEHFHCISQISYEIGLRLFYDECNEALVSLRNLIKLYNGSGQNALVNIIGGLRYDIPKGWIHTASELAEKLLQKTTKLMVMATRSQYIKDRCNKGTLQREEVYRYTLSGPNARASGVNFDIRKNDPYYFYHEIEFEVPVGTNGNTYDRMILRLEEIHQSFNIIMQVLDNLPSGAIFARESLTKNMLENAVTEENYREIVEKGRKLPTKKHYTCIEGPNGEMGLYLKSTGEYRFERAKFYSASMNSLWALHAMVKDQNYLDLPMIFASLNIPLAEVER